ncbi:sigma-54-dependent Fis family transcriptional regulator [Sneathiella litorea]|uniref:PAS domain-containing protein n=1 Tax=Sneathiella litorea TaxID=2606216 RepID=A0A6L8WAQ8_9PROT|nr:sigma-54-dependent Fis family transcriptional regulator [Sneathiella litorea]MZR31530.1 PAS domain-containing protein [Sneathiella litorea]
MESDTGQVGTADELNGSQLLEDEWFLASAILRQAFDKQPEPGIIFDPHSGVIFRANKAALDFFKIAENDIVGRTIGQIYSDEKGHLHVFTEEALYRGYAWTRDITLQRPDGKPMHLEHAAVAVTWQGKARMVVTITDLHKFERRSVDDEANTYHRNGLEEWRKAEKYFREIERENRLILAAAGEGIYGVNADGVTTFLNPAAEMMLGYSAAELVGRDMHSIIHHHKADGSLYDETECPIYNAFRKGTLHTVDDEVFWRKNNTSIRVEYTSTPIVDEGSVVGAVIVFREITQRKRDEEQLKAALEENARLRERLEMENAYLQEEIRSHINHYNILGNSQAIENVLKQIELVAPTDANVLITGESGTGKELVARAIHQASERRDRPLIRVNCAAVPRELFESEFFGHVKGAFTGALRDRIGRFELANGGTIFLDEVGEIPLDLQSKLLRVLQDQHFERVGEEKTREVDVRIIAATNRDLKKEASAKRFREDLFFRLNVFPIECLALRDRPSDIPILADHFLETVCSRLNIKKPTLTKANIKVLSAYDWPGNARELQNVIERSAILLREEKLSFNLPVPEELSFDAPDEICLKDVGKQNAILTAAELAALEKKNIKRALEAAGGRVSGKDGAAEMLQMKATTLYSRLKKIGDLNG